jgi:hypothetical protein
MIVNPRITNPSIPKDKDMIEIAASAPISLIPEAVKGLLQELDPACFHLTHCHSGSPCLYHPSLTPVVEVGERETANDW